MPGIEVEHTELEVFKIPYPAEKRLTLHDIQAEIDLLPQTISGHSPVNFNEYLTNTLERFFTLMENKFFISDEGIPNKIQGIGNLSGARLEIDYKPDLDILPTLYSMIGQLPTEYHQGAVWFTSPEIMTAIRNILDTTGRAIVSDELLGFPVYCHPYFNQTNSKIILANPLSGYVMITYPGLLADYNMTNDRKYVKYYFNRMVAGAVTDLKAWVSLGIKNLPPSLNDIHFKSFGPKT
jgi:HK97 family phage major capsid protein